MRFNLRILILALHNLISFKKKRGGDLKTRDESGGGIDKNSSNISIVWYS